MRSNGFGILLILLERIKRDIEQTCEGLREPPEDWKELMSRYDKNGSENLERTNVRIETDDEKRMNRQKEL